MTVTDEVGDAAGDDAGLAGAGTGEDQQWSLDVEDRGTLFGIEGRLRTSSGAGD